MAGATGAWWAAMVAGARAAAAGRPLRVASTADLPATCASSPIARHRISGRHEMARRAHGGTGTRAGSLAVGVDGGAHGMDGGPLLPAALSRSRRRGRTRRRQRKRSLSRWSAEVELIEAEAEAETDRAVGDGARLPPRGPPPLHQRHDGERCRPPLRHGRRRPAPSISSTFPSTSTPPSPRRRFRPSSASPPWPPTSPSPIPSTCPCAAVHSDCRPAPARRCPPPIPASCHACRRARRCLVTDQERERER